MLGIVVSRADSASVAIGEQLLERTAWETYEDDSRPDGVGGGTVYDFAGVQLREFEDLHLDLVEPAAAFDDPDLLVFASRHSGETGPLLTAHHTGNVGPADHGGQDNALADACPNALRTVVHALETYAPEEYDVGIECTHHGPTDVGAPSMFVEVGSAQPQWEDTDATRAVAQAILDLRGVVPHRQPEQKSDANWSRRQLVGIGGGHYAPRFERVLFETEWTVGHILADWGLDALGDLDSSTAETLFDAAFETSGAAYALVDGDRPDVRNCIDSLGYRAVSETWVRETDGVALEFVSELETEVLPIADGLRFGDPARIETTPARYEVVELPTDLLDEARGIDREMTYAALSETTLAFGTDQGGTRPTKTAVLDSNTDREAVIERLLSVLREKYDSVERDGESVTARQHVFNAEKARTLGVPDGPVFGRLASGEAVEIDGETIPPEVVHDERTREFSLRS